MKKQADHQGVLLVAISAVSFGLMPTFAKMAYSAGTSTYTLLLLRFAAAAAFMFALTRLKGLPRPTRRQAAAFFLMGAVGYVGQSFSYFTALNYASSSVVVLLFYTNPALVMLISALFLHERVTARKLLALTLAMLGAFAIVGSELDANPAGILFSILAAVSVLASVVVLGEPITVKILLGGCLVMASLLVTAIAPGKEASTEE